MIEVADLPQAVAIILTRREPTLELKYAIRNPSGDKITAFYYKNGSFEKSREFTWQ